MTAILLDVVFTLAVARAYSIPLSELLGTACDSSPIPIPSAGETQVGNGTPLRDGEGETEGGRHLGLTVGEREAAALLDVFNLTYTSAYRCGY